MLPNIHSLSCKRILHPYLVKNCERSEVLPSLQAHDLTCHTFIDAVRTRKIPGSETEDVMTNNILGRMSFMFTFILLPTFSKFDRGNEEEVLVEVHAQWVHVLAEKP